MAKTNTCMKVGVRVAARHAERFTPDSLEPNARSTDLTNASGRFPTLWFTKIPQLPKLKPEGLRAGHGRCLMRHVCKTLPTHPLFACNARGSSIHLQATAVAPQLKSVSHSRGWCLRLPRAMFGSHSTT